MSSDSDPWAAAKSGDYDKVVEWVSKGCNDVNMKNEDGFSLLHKACVGGQVKIAKYLLEQGALVNAVTKKGSMPIHVGGRAGHVEIVKILLEYNASIDSRTTDCWTVLHEACDNNKVDMVNFLLHCSAKVNTINEKGNTPLHAACEKGNLEIVRILLEHGAEKDAENVDGFTPLLRACTNGHLAVIKELYSKGANIWKTTKKGSTAMHLAARDGSKEVLQFLIQHGFDKDVRTPDQWTPLHEAADTNHPDVLEYLLKEKANINAQTQAENTPLHLAVKRRKFDAAYRLLNAAVPPDVTIKAKILASRNQGSAAGDVADSLRRLSISETGNQETDVFLSYDWNNQTNVLILYEMLLKNGYRVWMDKFKLRGGDKVNEEIDGAISNCKIVIACLTPIYLRSRTCYSHVIKANGQNKKIIALRFSSGIGASVWPPESSPISDILINSISIKVMEDNSQKVDDRGFKSLQGNIDKLLDAEH